MDGVLRQGCSGGNMEVEQVEGSNVGDVADKGKAREVEVAVRMGPPVRYGAHRCSHDDLTDTYIM